MSRKKYITFGIRGIWVILIVVCMRHVIVSYVDSYENKRNEELQIATGVANYLQRINCSSYRLLIQISNVEAVSSERNENLLRNLGIKEEWLATENEFYFDGKMAYIASEIEYIDMEFAEENLVRVGEELYYVDGDATQWALKIIVYDSKRDKLCDIGLFKWNEDTGLKRVFPTIFHDNVIVNGAL